MKKVTFTTRAGWIVQNEKTKKVKYVSISTADKESLSVLIRAKGTFPRQRFSGFRRCDDQLPGGGGDNHWRMD
jgi:hypothetical protein